MTCSPSAKLTSSIAAPPLSIWAAVRIIIVAGSATRLLATEPSAQPSGASSAMSVPDGLARSSAPRFIRRTPTSPSSTPATSAAARRAPRTLWTIAAQSGIVATITDVTPDESDCSAAATRPLPMTKNSTPVSADDCHSTGRGRGSPRSLATKSSSAPAQRNLRAPIRKGGKLSSASRIPR